jgi:hypothetical protein
MTFPSGFSGVRGDWVVRTRGVNNLVSASDFASRFTQYYPKPVDGVRIDPPVAIPSDNRTA